MTLALRPLAVGHAVLRAPTAPSPDVVDVEARPPKPVVTPAPVSWGARVKDALQEAPTTALHLAKSSPLWLSRLSWWVSAWLAAALVLPAWVLYDHYRFQTPWAGAWKDAAQDWGLVRDEGPPTPVK